MDLQLNYGYFEIINVNKVKLGTPYMSIRLKETKRDEYLSLLINRSPDIFPKELSNIISQYV